LTVTPWHQPILTPTAPTRLPQSRSDRCRPEGVEGKQTLALLREYGVDYAWGQYICHPTPIDTVAASGVMLAGAPAP
jgi:hypothetical protein